MIRRSCVNSVFQAGRDGLEPGHVGASSRSKNVVPCEKPKFKWVSMREGKVSACDVPKRPPNRCQ